MLKPGTGSAFALAAIAAGVAGGADALSGAEPPAAATPSMIAIGVPVGTVVPSCTSSSLIVPVTGEGTSEFTLSVETSTNASYFSTASPGCLSQRSTVPSVTVSPNCGIVIVVAI